MMTLETASTIAPPRATNSPGQGNGGGVSSVTCRTTANPKPPSVVSIEAAKIQPIHRFMLSSVVLRDRLREPVH